MESRAANSNQVFLKLHRYLLGCQVLCHNVDPCGFLKGLHEGSARLLCRVQIMPRRARAELARVFSRIIQARRTSGAQEDDILQCFIDSRYEKVRGTGGASEQSQ